MLESLNVMKDENILVTGRKLLDSVFESDLSTIGILNGFSVPDTM